MTPSETAYSDAQAPSGSPRRFVTDALAGLGLFCLLAVIWASTPSFAADMLLAELGRAFDVLAEASAASPQVLVLAAGFSVIFALNAAFFRHLTGFYAPGTQPSP